MEVRIDRSFQKDTRKITDKAILLKVAETIRDVQRADNIKQISYLKKLQGSKREFCIKLGDFRIGLIITKNKITFIRCLHRKDIYKYFPK